METQNVSAQLYFKQLPGDPSAGKFGCNETGDVLSTCVNDLQTDVQVENAFQSQLNLSEYYKSPFVFNSMKKDYMDKTMEGSNTPGPQESNGNVPPKPIPTPPATTVGPRDFLNNMINTKSTFGNTSNNTLILFILFIIIAVILYMLFIVKT
jgi:hypothetical protein